MLFNYLKLMLISYACGKHQSELQPDFPIATGHLTLRSSDTGTDLVWLLYRQGTDELFF